MEESEPSINQEFVKQKAKLTKALESHTARYTECLADHSLHRLKRTMAANA